MGLILDSGVFIQVERQKAPLDFSRWQQYGEASISVITASELWLASIEPMTIRGARVAWPSSRRSSQNAHT